MAGHSKWANIKRRKGAQDAARGKLFTKLIKEIMVAAKMGGSDIDANPRLRQSVDKAKSNSMPKANIERAIAKGAGEIGGANYEQITYEGYGPHGVAVLVQCLTDNRNRTVSEIRHAFTKYGGNLGTNGSVSYLFESKGIFTLPQDKVDEETVTMAALEGDAEDIEGAEGDWIVTCARDSYDACRSALAELGIEELSGELTMIPSTTVPLSSDEAGGLIKMLERLDDLDDVQETYSNAEFDL